MINRSCFCRFQNELLFESWNDIFDGSGAKIDPQKIYSFEKRQVLSDARWYELNSCLFYMHSENVNKSGNFTMLISIVVFSTIFSSAGEPEHPGPHDLVGDGAILFFLQEQERFKNLEWSRSWHRLVWLQAPAVFKNFVKNNDF